MNPRSFRILKNWTKLFGVNSVASTSVLRSETAGWPEQGIGMTEDKRDRGLGMDRPIRRRDFLNGMSVSIGASLVEPGSFWARVLADSDKPDAPEKAPGYYPPAKTGMRGSHDGSWEVAHAMRDGET